ncbi:LuxR C-terminal-related transcriptional regulator [Microbacterium hydrocarbonoxydans]|uniref:GAF domain-containing protein n=1 Tax=Microbacterium hydrocarbonoxydans TaxID=273678 RepID=A0A1H4K4R2_9MICO|nr:LuxR C-terminal-related transcriptional regulator [Microbacterium hydrocarbonoxydans]SEB53541.1 GAF domain-containing protein [Microbacterium hydrocarbonoxydans]
MSAPAQMESETELVTRAVRELAQRTRFPIAFGGLIDEGVVNVTSIVGNRTHSLDGLRVKPERGLGGRAIMELRPRMTNDYGSSQQITHDYDVYILGEGIRTLLALPIVVGGRPRGVLYAGTWERTPVGGVTTAPAMQVAQSVADELRIRDEVDRRLRAASPGSETVAPRHREELRESFAELRSIAASVEDAELRSRIAQVERRLVTLAEHTATPTTAPIPTIHLSRRETDVLACAALGATNAEIAGQLGLREGTVKAYLGTAMSKLDASTRHAAVAKARRAGILP